MTTKNGSTDYKAISTAISANKGSSGINWQSWLASNTKCHWRNSCPSPLLLTYEIERAKASEEHLKLV